MKSSIWFILVAIFFAVMSTVPNLSDWMIPTYKILANLFLTVAAFARMKGN